MLDIMPTDDKERRYQTP